MNPRASVIHSLVLLVALVISATANATSIYFPTFSAPMLQEERLVFTSPDSKRLLCADLNGKIAWEKKFESAIELFTGAESEVVVQVGKVVSAVSAGSGELRAKFTVEDENDGVSFSPELGSYVSWDRRFKERRFKLLDGTTGKPLWKTSDIESVVCATPNLMVCLAAERIPSGDGYRYGKSSLVAYDRKKFGELWSVPLAEPSPAPYLDAVFQAPFLVYVEARKSLVVLDCETGRKLVTKMADVPEGSWVYGLKLYDGHVVWLSHRMNEEDYDQSEHFLRFCTIPELREVRTVVLKLIEVARVSFEGGFIITDALYRTACFRPNGEKVWQKHQNSRGPVIDGRIYFSDQSKGAARVGVVEVATGKETILYTERLTKPEK